MLLDMPLMVYLCRLDATRVNPRYATLVVSSCPLAVSHEVLICFAMQLVLPFLPLLVSLYPPDGAWCVRLRALVWKRPIVNL